MEIATQLQTEKEFKETHGHTLHFLNKDRTKTPKDLNAGILCFLYLYKDGLTIRQLAGHLHKLPSDLNHRFIYLRKRGFIYMDGTKYHTRQPSAIYKLNIDWHE